MKRLLGFFIATLLLAFSLPAQAYVPPGANDPNQPHTWCQGCPGPHSNEALRFNAKANPQALDSLSQVGCFQFSITAMLVKAGVVPKGYNIMNMRADVDKLQKEGKLSMINPSNGYINTGKWAGLENLTGGKLEHTDPQQVRGRAGVEQCYNEGKLVIFSAYSMGRADGHWVNLDYIKDGKIHVNDSGYPGTVFDDQTYHGGRIRSVLCFKRTDGVDAKTLPHLSDGEAPGSKSGVAPKAGKRGGIDLSTLKDSEVKGMPPITEGQKLQAELAGYESGIAPISLETRESINDKTQLGNLDAFKEDIEREKWDFLNMFRRGLVLLGFLGYAYFILLLIARVADVTMSTDSLFVRILTLNYLGVASEKPHSSSKTTYVSNTYFTIICVVIGLVSTLLLGGTLVKYVSYLF